MDERNSIPVGNTAKMLKILDSSVLNYGGLLIGRDGNKIRVEFKDLWSAAAYVGMQKFEKVANFDHKDRPFDGPIVVTFHS